MPTVTRTVRQWVATIRRASDAPGLASRLRAATLAHAHAHPDDPLPVVLTDAEAADLERVAPLASWWMPATPGGVAIAEADRATADAADAFVRAQPRRPR